MMCPDSYCHFIKSAQRQVPQLLLFNDSGGMTSARMEVWSFGLVTTLPTTARKLL